MTPTAALRCALAALLLGAAGARAAEPGPGGAAAPGAGAPATWDRFPRAGAAYLVQVDGQVIWSREIDRALPPASLTKLMTGLLAVEAGGDPAAWARVSRRAAAATGSRLGLRAGEEVRAGDLLLATLVASANDACLALAEHVGGSSEAFVARMNARAAALGLTATHFANPCGHDAPGHQASARDLLRLAEAVLARPALRQVVAVERAQVVTRGGRALAVRTHNLLLGRVPGVDGVKSGYTQAAGRCIVAHGAREGHEVLVVLLAAPDRWWAALGLVEAGFEAAAARSGPPGQVAAP